MAGYSVDARMVLEFLLSKQQAGKFRYGNLLILQGTTCFYVEVQPNIRKSKSSAEIPDKSYLLAKATPLPSGAHEYFVEFIG